jgi:hypothetical protein
MHIYDCWRYYLLYDILCPMQIHIERCSQSTGGAVEAAICSLRASALAATHEGEDAPSMIWVDLPVATTEEESTSTSASRNGTTGRSGGTTCSWDTDVARIFQAAPDGTLLLAVTEGDVSAVRRMLARKQRSRWRDSSPWLDSDEELLVQAAGTAISGTAFFTLK